MIVVNRFFIFLFLTSISAGRLHSRLDLSASKRDAHQSRARPAVLPDACAGRGTTGWHYPGLHFLTFFFFLCVFYCHVFVILFQAEGRIYACCFSFYLDCGCVYGVQPDSAVHFLPAGCSKEQPTHWRSTADAAAGNELDACATGHLLPSHLFFLLTLALMLEKLLPWVCVDQVWIMVFLCVCF